MVEIEYRQCSKQHVELIAPQDRDRSTQLLYLRPEYIDYLLKDYALSAWVGSVCLGAAGVMMLSSRRGVAWALVSRKAGPYMRQITKKVREVVWNHPCERLDMSVAVGFKQGHTWAKLLGFEVEAPVMRKSGANGQDETLYARIK